MTDEILQSDIDLARRLINEGREDLEIIDRLARRNIAPERAGLLISELRQGRAVEPDRVWRALATQAQSTARPLHAQQISSAKATTQPKLAPITIPWFRILAATGVGLVIALAVLFGRQKNRHGNEEANGESASNPAAVAAGVNPSVDPASLMIEIRDGELKFHGRQVGAENAIQIFGSVLGPASRTNRVEALDKSVYVFDDYGLLIYPATGKNPNAVVIDFEASGGTNSAVHPFSGVLRIGGDSISKNSDPRDLTILRETTASKDTGNSGIYSVKTKGLRLVLACLNRTDRLSLVEIDFEESWADALH